MKHHNTQEAVFYKTGRERMVLTVMCFSTAMRVPFGTVCMLRIGGAAAEYTGMFANLFCYNKTLRSLEFICAGQIREDGMADLSFTHASFLCVLARIAQQGGT